MGLISTQGVCMQSKEFVGREDYLSPFIGALEKIRDGRSLNTNIIEYYGSPGIGKSSIMLECEREGQKIGRICRIDFSTLNADDIEYDPIILVEQIAKSLGVANKSFSDNLVHYRNTKLPDEGVISAYKQMDQETRLYQRPEWLDKLRNVVVSYLAATNACGYPVGILFDETDSISVNLIDWVEEWVINPTVHVKHAVIGWSAIRPWRWKRPEIRRRLTSLEVNPFDKRETETYLNENYILPETLTPAIIERLYEVTGGHPAALRAVIKNEK